MTIYPLTLIILHHTIHDLNNPKVGLERKGKGKEFIQSLNRMHILTTNIQYYQNKCPQTKGTSCNDKKPTNCPTTQFQGT